MSVILMDPGSRVAFRGRRYQVDAYIGTMVHLKALGDHPDGVADLNALVGDPSFGFLDPPPAGAASASSDFAWDSAEEAERERGKQLIEHLREMHSGFRSGTSSDALADEPRPQYDTRFTTSRQRREAKSAELAELGLGNWASGSLANMYTRAVSGGRKSALLDKRKNNSGRSPETLDYRALDMLLTLFEERKDASDTKMKFFRRELRVRLDMEYGEGVVPLPSSESVLNRHLKAHGKPLHFFGSNNAKGRQQKNLRPDTPYQRVRPSRMGQFVLIDGTRLDCFALDAITWSWVRLELVIALDLFTRSIVGWRFTPLSTDRVDAALLLRDIVMPKTMRPGWPANANWRYLGVPRNIVLNLTKDWGLAEEPAGVPIIQPDQVLLDNAWAYKSIAFMAGCDFLDISVMSARPIHPTDKAHVEAAFDFIKDDFVASLPGFKGENVLHRGANPEGEAFFFVHEIEELFARWVATQYQQRRHDGCRFCKAPKLTLSPNEMVEMSIAAGGFPHVPADRSLYYELLPCDGRVVHHYGVEMFGLIYDGPGLEGHREVPSGIGGRFGDGYPIYFDPRRLERIFFRDPDGAFHQLDWTGDPEGKLPFVDSMLAYFKRLVQKELKGRRLTPRELEAAYLKFLIEIRQRMAATGEEREILRRAMIDASGLGVDLKGVAPAPRTADPSLISFLDGEADDYDLEWDEDDPDDYGVLE